MKHKVSKIRHLLRVLALMNVCELLFSQSYQNVTCVCAVHTEHVLLLIRETEGVVVDEGLSVEWL